MQHFANHRAAEPFGTKGIIVLPRWSNAVGKSWQPLLQKYKLIHSYPAGTYLFHTPVSATESKPMGPTQWPVDVYLADHTVEERQAQSTANALRSESLKAMMAETKGKTYVRKSVKPHQPIFLHDKCYVTSMSDNDLLLFQTPVDELPSVKPTLMLDSGASVCFIDKQFVQTHQLPLTALDN